MAPDMRSLKRLCLVMVFTVPRLAYGQCGAWAPLVNLSNDTGRFAVDSNLAVDSSGKVHLIYQDFLSPTGQNYYVTNQSGTWSSPAPLGSMSDKGSAPKIVITPDSQLHVFFGKNNLYWRTKPVN